MTPLVVTNFEPKHFFEHYWQKQPLLIKSGFAHFTDPLDENDLAGLAQEEDIDSRIISHDKNTWQFDEGPFEDFTPFCKGKWTLLVQGVEKYLPDTAPILDAFQFLPNWRIDDLMVSFSVTGAGVGPHLDQYDVFIIQGKGKRHWKVGLPDDYSQLHPHPKLRHVSQFTPVIDAVLEAGDILYIPPSAPHEGVALEDCLNYSVGFRAPDNLQLLSALVDDMLDGNEVPKRYADPDITERASPMEIQQAEIQKAQNLMLQSLASDTFSHWFMRYASHALQDHELPEQQNLPLETIGESLTNDTVLVKFMGIKPIYQQPAEKTVNETIPFYIEGEEFHCEPSDWELIHDLLIQPNTTLHEPINPSTKSLISQLISRGYWQIIE